MERIADYEIIRRIGDANHGGLYLARAPERLQLYADDVVLKVFHARTSQATFRRATRELRAFAATRSEDLAVVYEAGQEGDHFFYTRKHYPDGTLATPERPLARSAIVGAVSHAARAAHALHEAGIAHRDIRPENIYLDDGAARLGELGLAQCLAPGQTVTGISQQSSLEYLDPHLLTGGRGSRASDVWALGVTLHRALTGHGVYPDFPIDDPLRAFRTLLTCPPVLGEGLGAAERDLVARCLAPLSERWTTAADVADRLDELVMERSAASVRTAGLG